MTDKGWKKMEGRVAAVGAGERYRANKGRDVELEREELVPRAQ